ncbi:MAG: ester cyclase [Gammaproteobacteria bacterium]|nr:ester cyclase [Gammaproteobacteria bacterium]
MSRQRAEEVMRRYLTEVVAQGKLELIDELAAEDMVDHTQTIPGRAGLVAHVKSFRERNRDVELNVERIIASDDEGGRHLDLAGNPLDRHVRRATAWRQTRSPRRQHLPASGRNAHRLRGDQRRADGISPYGG